MEWTYKNKCTSRTHCRACRNEAWWRQSEGAPDVCPYGVTAADAKRKRHWLVPDGAVEMCESCGRKGPCPNRSCSGCSEGRIITVRADCPEGLFRVVEVVEQED